MAPEFGVLYILHNNKFIDHKINSMGQVSKKDFGRIMGELM